MAWLRIALAAVLVLVAVPSKAVEPDEVLSDPALEERARDLSTELRCLVCQNQSIDDSDAPLAKDLRVLIRERISAGDSDVEVIDLVVDRYGEFVLLRPRFAPHTWPLWLGAPVLLLLGVALIVLSFRRRHSEAAPAAEPLSAKEQKDLERLLKD